MRLIAERRGYCDDCDSRVEDVGDDEEDLVFLREAMTASLPNANGQGERYASQPDLDQSVSIDCNINC